MVWFVVIHLNTPIAVVPKRGQDVGSLHPVAMCLNAPAESGRFRCFLVQIPVDGTYESSGFDLALRAIEMVPQAFVPLQRFLVIVMRRSPGTSY